VGYPGFPTDPRTMPMPPYMVAPQSVPLNAAPMPPQMMGQQPGVPYPSMYPGIPMVQPQPPRKKVNPLLIVVIVLVLLALVAGGVALALSRGPSTGSASGRLSATPTVAATATTSVPAGFTAFKDQGGVYSLDVPSGWSSSKTASGSTTINVFVSIQPFAEFEIAALPGSGLDPTTAINGYFSGVSGGQAVTNKSAPSSIQQAGETWTQESADTTLAGQPVHMVVLLAQHGANAVLLAYFAPSASFASINSQDFQPMFTSFQFLS
ncbi:MAG: hypothetical protein ACRDHP_18120, partial [Ktedonobacterales bacterium]